MLSFFEPRYVKEARVISRNARKLIDYKRDLLSAASLADFETTIGRLDAAAGRRDRTGIDEAAGQLDKQWARYLPPARESGLRENCEVFLVAIVVAIGVRTFFLQPFTIPTGSMQPTLNGFIGTPNNEPAPGPLKRVVDFVVRGRNYIDITSKTDDVVTGLAERKVALFLTVTDIQCARASYTAWAPMDVLERTFGVYRGREYKAGQTIAHGTLDAGDNVFVDKVSYNFRLPERGQVFVFSTHSIRRIEADLRAKGIEGSQFFIKRLAGTPGDTLRVDPPRLFVNGQEAREPGFQKVMSEKGPTYRGYSNPPGGLDMPPDNRALYLTSPEATYQVQPGHYFAMGDNSYNSFDSRYWGPVPQDNLMGRGLFVYWPFSPHWGFVH